MFFKYLGPFYVYALIDPDTQIPFYIGKGTTNRIVEHFRQADAASADDQPERVGLSPEELVEIASRSDAIEHAKVRKIAELRERNYGPQQIARVICRRISQEAAFALEACLIKSVYGLQRLTNIQDGHHTERYCPHHPEKFEPDLDAGSVPADFSLDAVTASGENYVYALIDPESDKIFYVGKGKGKRVLDHFANARSHTPDEDLSDKLAELSRLLDEGYTENQLARILARGISEDVAFLLESMFIRFVYGYARLTNIQPGHYSHLFRSKSDWELRSGLDIPIVIKKGQPRDELRDDFFGQEIHQFLYQIRDQLQQHPAAQNLVMSDAFVFGAGELCIDAVVDDVIKLRIQSRATRRAQVSLFAQGTSKHERWLVRHFQRLGKFPYHRRDFRFSPQSWWGPNKVTPDVNIAVKRALMLLEVVRADSLDGLSAELKAEVFEGLPSSRDITPKESKRLSEQTPRSRSRRPRDS